MFERMLRDEAMQADQWKIYPTQVVPWTKIKQWYEAGSYVPYAFDHMYELLVQAKSRVHPWIRLNRVVRDIPIQVRVRVRVRVRVWVRVRVSQP